MSVQSMAEGYPIIGGNDGNEDYRIVIDSETLRSNRIAIDYFLSQPDKVDVLTAEITKVLTRCNREIMPVYELVS